MLLVAAGLLALFAVVLVGPCSVWLARASWVSQAPRSAVLLWQALGIGALLSTVGAGLCIAVVRFHAGFVGGLDHLADGIFDGHPLRGLGLPDALGLTLAADVGVVLFSLLAATVARTALSRARHRRLLDILGGASPLVRGAVLLDHPHALAYCLPGWRPRIVVSTGTTRVLSVDELAAVIGHEQGHASEHHGLILLPMGGLTDLFHWIPFARLAPASMALLLEMAADDHAARRHRPAALASALVHMSTGAAPPSCAFGFSASGAAAGASARVDRLLSDDRLSRRAAVLACLGATALVVLPVVGLALG
jgi:Zn-dependent protease with chaperone function